MQTTEFLHAAPLLAASTQRRGDQTKRRIVQLTVIVYWLLIFEGALRKWVFPAAADVLFFIRDPFVLAIYFLALRRGILRNAPYPLAIGLALGVLFTILVAVQAITLEYPLLVFAYGWRNYFFYLPLAFVMGRTFEARDVNSLIRWTLLAAIPIAILVCVQFFSPPDAFVNRTYNESATIFMVNEDHVRTYGTFTFTAGQATFVGSLIAMAIGTWVTRAPERPITGVQLALATIGVVTNFAMSGSRTVYFFAASALAACVIGIPLFRRSSSRVRTLVLPLSLFAFSGIAFVGVFTEAFSAMQERQTIAVEAEGSTVDRAAGMLTSFTSIIDEAPLLGFGVGFGTNAGAKVATGTSQFTLGEDEASRIIWEAGPIFGLAYLGLRVLLIFWLFARVTRTVRAYDSPIPLLLFSFTAIMIIASPLTMQGTINGYGWFFLGLTIAASRLGTSLPRSVS